MKLLIFCLAIFDSGALFEKLGDEFSFKNVNNLHEFFLSVPDIAKKPAIGGQCPLRDFQPQTTALTKQKPFNKSPESVEA